MINKYILKPFLVVFLLFLSSGKLYSENHNVLQILEALQQDIKTLERAVYSNSFETKNKNNEGENFTENSSELRKKRKN